MRWWSGVRDLGRARRCNGAWNPDGPVDTSTPKGEADGRGCRRERGPRRSPAAVNAAAPAQPLELRRKGTPQPFTVETLEEVDVRVQSGYAGRRHPGQRYRSQQEIREEHRNSTLVLLRSSRLAAAPLEGHPRCQRPPHCQIASVVAGKAESRRGQEISVRERRRGGRSQDHPSPPEIPRVGDQGRKVDMRKEGNYNLTDARCRPASPSAATAGGGQNRPDGRRRIPPGTPGQSQELPSNLSPAAETKPQHPTFPAATATSEIQNRLLHRRPKSLGNCPQRRWIPFSCSARLLGNIVEVTDGALAAATRVEGTSWPAIPECFAAYIRVPPFHCAPQPGARCRS